MLKCIFCVALLSAVPSPAFSQDDWTTVDTAMAATMTALTIADWTQTLHIARNPDRYREDGFAKNLIGEHPTRSEVNRYFVCSLLFKHMVAYLLPKPYHTVWHVSMISISYSNIQNNRRIGIGISMHL